MKKIKLMTDYQCFPIWWDEADTKNIGSIEPSSLPLRRSTIGRLLTWQGKYDQQLDVDDPSNSSWFSEKELEDFENEGLALWEQVSRELTGEYLVSYFSQKQQALLQPDDFPTYSQTDENSSPLDS